MPSASPGDDDLLRLDRQVCFALAVAARNVIALYRPLLEPMGLTHPQYLVLLALWERSPRSLGDLARELALDPGTLSPLLKRLEAAGLVDRRRVPGDERTMAVSLTAAGRPGAARAGRGHPRGDRRPARDAAAGAGGAADGAGPGDRRVPGLTVPARPVRSGPC